MYAVIKTGGKQYRVKEGDVLRVEKLAGEKGSSIELTGVLSAGEGSDIKVGIPEIPGAKVTAEIIGHGKDKKVDIFKKKRRKGYTKRQGHRQSYTSIRVKDIKV